MVEEEKEEEEKKPKTKKVKILILSGGFLIRLVLFCCGKVINPII